MLMLFTLWHSNEGAQVLCTSVVLLSVLRSLGPLASGSNTDLVGAIAYEGNASP